MIHITYYNSFMWEKFKEAGQTSVEYILLIVVVVTVATSLFSSLEGYLITNPNSLKNRYLGGYKNMFSGSNGSFQGQYKRFTVRR
jgi:hypothetical protein